MKVSGFLMVRSSAGCQSGLDAAGLTYLYNFDPIFGQEPHCLDLLEQCSTLVEFASHRFPMPVRCGKRRRVAKGLSLMRNGLYMLAFAP